MSVVPLVVEGAQSSILPCSAILLVPAIGTLLAARRDWLVAVPVTIGAAGLSAWIRFSGVFSAFSGWLIGVCLLIGIGLVWAAAERHVLGVIVGAGLVGVAASQLWQPCVGEHFGQLVSDLTTDRLAGLVPLVLYVAAVNTPVMLVAAAIGSLSGERRESIASVTAPVGAGIVVVLGVLALVGQTDQLIARLVSWSI